LDFEVLILTWVKVMIEMESSNSTIESNGEKVQLISVSLKIEPGCLNPTIWKMELWKLELILSPFLSNCLISIVF